MSTKEKLRLKDQATTFHDPETRLSIAGDEVVELDPKARKGRLTISAIKAGGLIEVKAASEKKEDSKKGDGK
jgi:hypothetical protein